jgi:hypothetical protein
MGSYLVRGFAVSLVKYLLNGFGDKFSPSGSFDAGFKKVLKLAKRLFLGLGFRLRRRRQHPLQHVVLDTLVMQSGYGLEPRMLFRCDFDGKTHGFTS